jgi:hypothetical protein
VSRRRLDGLHNEEAHTVREEDTTPDEGNKLIAEALEGSSGAALPEGLTAAEAITRLAFELDMTDGYIEDLWREVFGPTKPMPTKATSYSVGPRRTALKRILSMCSCVNWEWRERAKGLPEGVVADDSCPGGGECHGSQTWCEVCGDVRRVCDDRENCDEHSEAGLVRRGLVNADG